MKKTIAIATFVALGAGTVSAGALSDISFKGSDTLFALTGDVIAACPGATGLTYLGQGSGAGETAILAGTAQTIAPMSRFLANSAAVCGNTNIGSAEGFAVAADGLSVFVSSVHRAACDAASSAEDCNRLTDPLTGLAYNTAIPLAGGGTYQLTDWRDALRVIYHGIENNDGPFPITDVRVDAENAPVTNPPAARIRDCNSPVRQALVANWSRLFQNGCSGAGANCTTLQHAFRRDQNSGTTDVFRELIQSSTSARTENRSFPFCNETLDGGETGAAPACPPSGLAPSSTYCAVNADCGAGVTCNIVGGVGMCNPTACTVDTDCSTAFNARLAADPVPANGASFPGCGGAGQPPCPVCRGNICVPNLPGSPGSPTPPYFEAFQDRDPVRRPCIASPANACNLPVVGGGPLTAGACEQVCGARGDLGLVLPIAVPSAPAADAYPTVACQNNRFELGQAPVLAVGLQARNGLCPNGDMPRGGRWEPMSQAVVGGVGCLIPVSPAGDRRCVNGKNSRPLPQNPPPGFVGQQCAQLPGVTAFDGRVYNLHPHLQSGNYLTQAYTFLGVSGNRFQVGAFYRMHVTRTAMAADPNCVGDNCCTQLDSTRQIACLVQANPCSIGFAGREGTTVGLVTTVGPQSVYSSSVDAVSPVLDSCIIGGQYRLGRNLWVNSMIGMRNVAGGVDGDEAGLVQCYNGNGTTTPITTLVSARDFVPITPFCNDYNSALCNPSIPNAGDACADNPAGLPNVDNAVVP